MKEKTLSPDELEALERELVSARDRVERLEQKVFEARKAVQEADWAALVDAILAYEERHGPIKICDVSGDYYRLGDCAEYNSEAGLISIYEEER